MNTRKSFPLIGLAATLLAIWMFREPITSGLAWMTDREAVAGTLQELGIWGPVVLSLLLILQVFFAFIPGQALMVTCGYLYGFWGGLLITWSSLVLGGFAAFILARRYGRLFAERWVPGDKLSRWDQAASGQGILFFAASLVLPIFPNDAMCYVAGLGKISPRRFLIANMLGRGMACLLASLVGAFGSGIPVWGWVCGVGLILAGCFVWWMKGRRSSAPGGNLKEATAFASDGIIRLILKAYARVSNRNCTVSGPLPLPRGPKIIALNHTDGCDPFFLPLILEERPHFLLQDGLFKIPVVGRLLKAAGQIPVYRETDRAKEAYEQACELLRRGKTVVIFPEGKQVPAGHRIPAKTGTVRMSLETGAPIIPVGLYVPPENLVQLKFNFQGRDCRGLLQVTGRSYMRFGEAWRPEDHTLEATQPDFHVLTEELMNRIYRLVAEIEKEIPCESRFSHRFFRPWSVEHP